MEDKIFSGDSKGTSMTSTESARIGSQVKTYRTTVDDTRTEVAQVVPMPKYNEMNWVDIATNPFALAAGAVLIYKGLMSTIPFGSKADDAVSRAITYPVRGALNGANTAYNKVRGKK